MGPKRIQSKIFPLFIVKFKKLGFIAPLMRSFLANSLTYSQFGKGYCRATHPNATTWGLS